MKSYPSLSHWGAFTAKVEQGRLVGVEPFVRDPHPSRFNEAWLDMAASPLRVARPVVRKGWLAGDGGAGRGEDAFVAVPWDEALDLVAGKLRTTMDEHGIGAVFGGSYGWSSAGRIHHARTLVHRFLGTLGPFTSQTTNYSFGAAMLFLPWVLGTHRAVSSVQTTWQSIARNADVVLAFGGIPAKNYELVSGGVAQHRYEDVLDELRASDVRVVNISPFRGDIDGRLPHDWIAPRPNTDTALLLALCHHLASRNLHDRNFLNRYCDGYDEFESYLLGVADGVPKTAEWAAGITGLEAARIEQLAASLVGRRVMITATWSLQRARHGEQPYWAIITLAAMLGQIGLAGGGFGFGHGSSAGMGNPDFNAPLFGLARDDLKAGVSIPVARVADLLLNPGETVRVSGKTLRYPDIRLVYWAGGNPFHHHQDLNRLREAFRRPETIVVHEQYWTATARHADIVLPASIPLERNDIGGSSRERYIFAMHKACEPFAEARDDYDIFADLARRLGTWDEFTEGRDEADWLRWSWQNTTEALARRGISAPSFDEFWSKGHFEMPDPEADFILLERFRDDPETNPLPTPSGRIQIVSHALRDACGEEQPGHAAWLDPEEWLGSPRAADHPLHLLTPQPARHLHGQLDASAFNRAGKHRDREYVTIHAGDAASRGIRQDDIVRLFNDRGSCLAAANVTDTIMPGVVALPTGAAFDPDGTMDRNSNPNLLTRDVGSSEIGQGCSAQSCLVEVELFIGELPKLTVYDPPAIE